MAYPATPRTWVAGDILTAAQMNAELRDALLGAFPLGPPDAAWTSYTPTLTQGVAVAKTSTHCRYQRVGRTIFCIARVVCTGTGTAAAPVQIGLPVAASPSLFIIIGAGLVYDASASQIWKGIVNMNNASYVQMYWAGDSTASSLGQVGFTAALTTSDEVQIAVMYEAAT